MVAVIRRKYLGGAAVALGGLLAAACGEPTVRYVGQPQAGPAGPAGPQGVKGATGAQGAQGAQGAAGIAAKKPPAVQFWHWAGPQHRFSLANVAVVEDFKARNERAALVDIQTAGDGRASMSKIKSFLAADTPPNVWTPWQVEAADLFSLGAVIDLDAALRTNQDWATAKPNMIPFLLEGVLWKGQQTLMPMFPDPHGQGYNTHILREAGLDFPADGYTWEDFIGLGQKIYIPEKRRLVDFGYDGHRMLWWMGNNGGFPIDDTRTKLQWDSPIARETLEWAHEHAKRTRLFISQSEFNKDNPEPYTNSNGNFNKGGRLANIINPGTVTPPRYPDIDPGDGSGIPRDALPDRTEQQLEDATDAGQRVRYRGVQGAGRRGAAALGGLGRLVRARGRATPRLQGLRPPALQPGGRAQSGDHRRAQGQPDPEQAQRLGAVRPAHTEPAELPEDS